MAVTACGAGCTTVIVQPLNPPDPVSVFVVDYGRHAELVLPDGDGGSAAYVYGDWDYFALGRNDAWHGFVAVVVPTQGALGRRLASGTAPRQLCNGRGPEAVLELQVSREQVASLLEKLDARFSARLDTRVYNRDYALEFVKDPASYIWFHNCNAELAGWLRELGCVCRGPGWTADFVVEQAPEA